MDGVPHAPCLRVGVLVVMDAEGTEALHRAWGTAFSYVQLLPAAAAVGDGTGAQSLRSCAWRDSSTVQISAG